MFDRFLICLLHVSGLSHIWITFWNGMLFIAYKISGTELGFSLWNVLVNAFGINMGWATNIKNVNGPTWYISVLLLCYVVFYFLTWISKKIGANPIISYICIIFLGMSICTYGLAVPFLNFASGRGYMAFFVGIIVNMISEKYVNKDWRIDLTIFAGLLLSIYIIIWQYWFIQESIMYICTFVLWPLVVLVLNTNVVVKMFNFRLWGFLGEASYLVYIWHEPFTTFRNMISNGMGVEQGPIVCTVWIITMWIIGIAFYEIDVVYRKCRCAKHKKAISSEKK